MADTTADVETPAHHDDVPKSAGPNLGLAFSEAAALLTIWSLLVINEGAIRFNGLTPYGDFSSGSAVPATNGVALGIAFFAALFEVIFGLMGLFLGIAALIFRFYSTPLTKLFMIAQSAMGWYVFIVYVFAIPASRAANLTEGVLGLSVSLSRFLITLGIFTSFHFCLALQGGQFVFFARLVVAATGEDFLMQKSGYQMRAMFWNGNLALAGLWTFITGCILNHDVDAGRFPDEIGFFAFPPNVGRVPGLTITTGLFMLLWGMYGVILPALKMKVAPWYYLVSGIIYLWAFLNFTIAQFGTLDAPGPAGIGMHTGLVFMVAFLGPYFVYRNQYPEMEEHVA